MSEDAWSEEVNAFCEENMTEMWEMTEEDVQESCENPYIKELTANSRLHLLQPDRIKQAYNQNKELGLFRLFLSKSFFKCVLRWTNEALNNDGRKPVSESKLWAYIGLEVGMSLVQMNDISAYWETKMFSGHSHFINVMSRDDFETIRSHLSVHPASAYNHTIASTDPLWHSRKIMEQFMKNAATLAVPEGTSAFDENTARTKARTSAKSYIPSKPDKYGIRFYANVGWKSLYLHTIFDDGSGNKTGKSPAERYCEVFRDIL